MKQTRSDQPSVVHLDGREYVVDLRTREFRNAGFPSRRIDSESPEGRGLWNQLMILRCSKFGLVAVESRHMSGVRCQGCRGWLLV